MPVPEDKDSNSLNAQAIAAQNAQAMKKIVVNAQIAAIFSASELLGIILTAITAYLFDSPRLGGLLLRVVENVLLPSLYLLKTDENIDQIVQVGWKVVYQGIINFANFSLPWKRSNAVVSINIKYSANNHGEEMCKIIDNSKKEFQQLDVGSLTHRSNFCNINVPDSGNPISTKIDDTHSNSHPSLNSENVPSCSGMKKEDETVTFLKHRRQILDELKSAIEDEFKYLRTFTIFNFLEYCKYNKDYMHSLEVVEDETILLKMIKISSNDQEGKRFDFRTEKVKELQNVCNDEDAFQIKLNELIDFEELLLNDDMH